MNPQYIKETIEEAMDGKITSEDAIEIIMNYHHLAMKDFTSEMLKATRSHLIQCENNLFPIGKKYGVDLSK